MKCGCIWPIRVCRRAGAIALLFAGRVLAGGRHLVLGACVPHDLKTLPAQLFACGLPLPLLPCSRQSAAGAAAAARLYAPPVGARERSPGPLAIRRAA